MPVVHASYYTDPLCVWSWGTEPQLRRLLVEFGEGIRITYVMAGMSRESPDPEEMLEEWLDVTEQTGMPVDPRLWLADPPRSSYPACMAVKAAAEQGDPGPYLRSLREGLMCERRRLDHAEAFMGEAREVAGLDLDRFRIDLGSHAIVEAFGADMERGQAANDDPERDRVPLPTLELRGEDGEDGEVHRVLGPPDSYDAWRAAAVAAGAEPLGTGPPGIEDALRRFGRMATAEVAAVCELPGPRAAAELWRLASEWRVRPERRLTGELWSLT